MFEGLNAIPWGELDHAYGSAEEVPVWLRRLTSDDAEVHERAVLDLWNSICHQGTVYSATTATVPFLIQMLEEPNTREKDEILHLLADIAVGSSWWDGNVSLLPPFMAESADAPGLKEEILETRSAAEQARAATRAGFSTYAYLVHDTSPQVRMRAAHLLSRFHELAGEVSPVLKAALDVEMDARVRANLVLLLGHIADGTPENRRFFEHLTQTSGNEVERLAAALALTRLAREQTPDTTVDFLVGVMAHPSEALRAAYEELPSGGIADVDAMYGLCALGPARLRFAIPLLTDMLRAAERSRAWHIAHVLLFIVFNGRPSTDQEPRVATTLTEEQRDVLNAICDRAEVWGIGDAVFGLESFGFPSSRRDLSAYLGREDLVAAMDEQARAYRQRPRPPNRFETYMQRVKEVYPELLFSSYGGKSDPSGQNNDIITANDYSMHQALRTIIFRFPRHAQAVEEMEREIAILRGLQGRLPLPIPNPTYSGQGTREVGRAFMGYEKLPGRSLYRELLESVDGEGTVQRLATQLAEFLRALHDVPADVFAIPPPVTNSHATWALMYDRIRKKLFWHMRPDAREQVSAHFEQFLDEPRNFEWTPVLIHGDFGPGNILYDAKQRTISGIIDFSSAGLGDPATDLAALITPHSYGEGFLARLVPAYPGIADLVERARFYMGTFALQEALFGVEHDDREAFARGMAQYT